MKQPTHVLVATGLVILTLAAGCGKTEPTVTVLAPAAAAVVPTDTPVPPPATPSPLPPTDTPFPTDTSVPPTPTPEPSATSLPTHIRTPAPTLSPWASGPRAAMPLPSPTASKRSSHPLSLEMDVYIQAHADSRGFMGTVLVARGDDVLLNEGYGMANMAKGIANTTLTQFRLGSISKAFTAAAIMQMQENGLLSVEDPVSKYLPDYAHGDRITIHHLLNHTSGVPNFVGFPDVFTMVQDPIALDDLIALFSNRELEFAPGQRFYYSNSGYVLCAKIIEVVSGQTYAHYVKTHILDPVGMEHSGCDFYDDIEKTSRAIGYHFTGETYLPTPRWDTSWAVGDGAIYSTVEDMYLWSQALDTTSLLSEASLEAMFEPGGPGGMSYGYGWYVGEYLDRRRVLHGGYVFGFRCDFTRYPDDKVVIVVLSNVDQAGSKQMAEDLAAMLFGAPYEMPEVCTPAEVDPAILATYAGQYDTGAILDPGAVITISTEDSHLLYQSNSIYDSLAMPVVLYP